jgi:D-alanyl-D-alanine carboxypeptidase (penicillin-binding protein 5/6)
MMRKAIKAIKVICVALLIINWINIPATFAQAQTAQAKSKSSKSSKSKISPVSHQALLLMEADTGQILYEENPHKKWPPASMVKMMLMLIVMEKVKEGSVKLADNVTVSAWASKIGGSQVYLKEGEVFSLEQLMEAVAIASANDASTAIAEHVAGSVEGFVQLMNDKAKELKLNDTQYSSVHGLPPDPGQEEDVTSAFDSAILGRQLLKYPEVLRWTSTREAKFRDGKLILTNTNHLIGSFRGANGLKTGYYSKAGFSVTATANRDNMRLIAVVLGSSTNKARFQEAARLLSTGFNTYKKLTVLKKDQPFDKDIPVKDAKVKVVRPVVAQDAIVLIKRSEEKSLTSQPTLPEFVKAPINKGQELGKVLIKLPNRTLATVSLVSPQEVPKASWLWRLFHP